jgi:homoprotocatechuate degradation regulator HpaR
VFQSKNIQLYFMKHVNEPQFTPTRQSLPISLLRVRELIMESIRPMLASHDVTEQQWRVLRVISEEGEADATTVAHKACMLAPSLTRILRTLQNKGHVKVFKDAKDGRRTLMSLTESGTVFLSKVAPESQEIFSELHAIVGKERWEELIKVLCDIRDDINAARQDKD